MLDVHTVDAIKFLMDVRYQMAYVLKHQYFTVFKISDSADVLFDSI